MVIRRVEDEDEEGANEIFLYVVGVVVFGASLCLLVHKDGVQPGRMVSVVGSGASCRFRARNAHLGVDLGAPCEKRASYAAFCSSLEAFGSFGTRCRLGCSARSWACAGLCGCARRLGFVSRGCELVRGVRRQMESAFACVDVERLVLHGSDAVQLAGEHTRFVRVVVLDDAATGFRCGADGELRVCAPVLCRLLGQLGRVSAVGQSDILASNRHSDCSQRDFAGLLVVWVNRVDAVQSCVVQCGVIQLLWHASLVLVFVVRFAHFDRIMVSCRGGWVVRAASSETAMGVGLFCPGSVGIVELAAAQGVSVFASKRLCATVAVRPSSCQVVAVAQVRLRDPDRHQRCHGWVFFFGASSRSHGSDGVLAQPSQAV